MEKKPGHFEVHRSIYLNPTLIVDIFDRVDSTGYGHVGLRFQHQVSPDESRVFRAHLEHIEEAVSRCYVYRNSHETTERLERFRDIDIRLTLANTTEGESDISVALTQKAGDASGEWQSLETFYWTLHKAASLGQEVEKELGYTDRYNVLIDIASLKKDAQGRIFATVIECMESNNEGEAESKLRLHNAGLPSRDFRRRSSVGDIIELSPDREIEFEVNKVERGSVVSRERRMLTARELCAEREFSVEPSPSNAEVESQKVDMNRKTFSIHNKI